MYSQILNPSNVIENMCVRVYVYINVHMYIHVYGHTENTHTHIHTTHTHIYIYIYISSSSSCRTASTDFPSPLSLPIFIVHRSRHVFLATCCIGTELQYTGARQYISDTLKKVLLDCY